MALIDQMIPWKYRSLLAFAALQVVGMTDLFGGTPGSSSRASGLTISIAVYLGAMFASKVLLECSRINDWASFHEEFASAFGFPDFYGRNMEAWIDCMSSVDDPQAEMSAIHCMRGSMMTLDLRNVKEFKQRSRELYDAIIEGVAFVNWRRLEAGESALLAISFYT